MISQITVDLFRAPLDLDADLLEAFAATLSEEELQRAGDGRVPTVQARIIADHGWRRRLLAEMIGSTPERLTFTRDGYDKPRLSGGRPHFSASRSDDVAYYAVCEHAEVGVDIERISTGRPLERLAHRLLSERERRIYDSLPAAERARALTACWTCKEAAGKALGRGLVFPVTSLEAWPGEDLSIRAHGLEVRRVDADECHAAAVAVRVAEDEMPAIASIVGLSAP